MIADYKNAAAQRIGQAWSVGYVEFFNDVIIFIKNKIEDEDRDASGMFIPDDKHVLMAENGSRQNKRKRG